jgi:predicted GNAT family acetyltransferase
MYNMKKSQLRHLIREEIKKAYSVNENVPDDGNVYGWYWPIADQAMEMIKTDSKYSGASLGAVGSGDGVTYITITVDLPSGSEEHFVVNFDENRQATDIESTFISEELEGEGTYRVYMNSDPDEPERINYEIYFGDGTKAEMIKQAKEMAYSNDPTNQYGDPILVKVVHEDDIDDVAFTNESVNEANSDWPLENKKWEKLWNDALTAPNTNTERKLMRWIVTNAKK